MDGMDPLVDPTFEGDVLTNEEKAEV